MKRISKIILVMIIFFVGLILNKNNCVQADGQMANFTTEQFIQSVANVYKMAHDNGFRYASSGTLPPCDDGLISCDRLVARAIYDLGLTDQNRGGITCGNIEPYLTTHGWTNIKGSIEYHGDGDTTDFQAGDVIFIDDGDHSNNTPRATWHVFVLSEYDANTKLCSKYDTGSQSSIDSMQPFTNVPVMHPAWVSRGRSVRGVYRLTNSNSASGNVKSEATFLGTIGLMFRSGWDAVLTFFENSLMGQNDVTVSYDFNYTNEQGGSVASGDISAMIAKAQEIATFMAANNFYYYTDAGLLRPDYRDTSSRQSCCSTYVSWVLQEAGIINYHFDDPEGMDRLYESEPQNWNKFVASSEADLQIGDIQLYYGYRPSRGKNAHHVNIYAGNGQYWDAGASGSGAFVGTTKSHSMEGYSYSYRYIKR